MLFSAYDATLKQVFFVLVFPLKKIVLKTIVSFLKNYRCI